MGAAVQKSLFPNETSKVALLNVGSEEQKGHEELREAARTNEKKRDAENYHYFTWDHKGGVTGIAGVGTICSSSKTKRTAITEWVQNEDEHYSEQQCLLVFTLSYFIFHISKLKLYD